MNLDLYKLVFTLPETRFKNEKDFTAWFGRKIHDKGGMWHKISDMSIDYKPCDAIFGLDGLCGLIELKHGKEKNKVDVLKKLRNNQIFGLENYKKNGGTSIVVYYNEVHHRYWIFEFGDNMNLLLSK